VVRVGEQLDRRWLVAGKSSEEDIAGPIFAALRLVLADERAS
jgi:hypothetical protein